MFIRTAFLENVRVRLKILGLVWTECGAGGEAVHTSEAAGDAHNVNLKSAPSANDGACQDHTPVPCPAHHPSSVGKALPEQGV